MRNTLGGCVHADGGSSVGEAVFSVVMGAAAVLVGRLTLGAKSLIYPGYRDFGMSDERNWALQRVAGWGFVVFGCLIFVLGAFQLITALVRGG